MFVLAFKTGNGKILFTKEIAGPVMHKIVAQMERREDGIRSMELVDMPPAVYDKLPFKQIAILEIEH